MCLSYVAHSECFRMFSKNKCQCFEAVNWTFSGANRKFDLSTSEMPSFFMLVKTHKTFLMKALVEKETRMVQRGREPSEDTNRQARAPTSNCPPTETTPIYIGCQTRQSRYRNRNMDEITIHHGPLKQSRGTCRKLHCPRAIKWCKQTWTCVHKRINPSEKRRGQRTT